MSSRPSPPPPQKPPTSTSSSSSKSSQNLPSSQKYWYYDTVKRNWNIVDIVPDMNVSEHKGADPQSVVINTQGQKTSISFGLLFPTNPQVVSDITSLHYIHEPGILYNLQLRAKSSCPYTFMASAMIAVNPLRKIGDPPMLDYIDKSGPTIAPHPYSIAELAHQNLSFSGINQSIIISGESGAGKTETAKIILRYLSLRNTDNKASSSHDSLDKRLLQSSPILESFGNAKTLRNSNSSRFGKFMKLCFEKASTTRSHLVLVGAMVETYLLEKSRVVQQSEGEGNFHIFYQLIQSLGSSNSLYHLTSTADFNILTHSQVVVLKNIQEVCDLNTVQLSFRTIGLNDGDIHEIWSILASILHIGNIHFEDIDSPEGPIAHISNKTASSLQYASELLQVNQDSLRLLLTQREMISRNETFLIPLSCQDAIYTRDATVKGMYEGLFHYIVSMVNQSLSNNSKTTSMSQHSFVGVLDIFGFENFQRNEFEQLLINYANEALQNTFNKQIFEREIELFKKENIQFNAMDCPNNSVCVEMIGGKQQSVLSILDSISKQPQPSDERFCEELHKILFKQKVYFPTVHRKDMRSNFQIMHYAGVVRYTVDSVVTNSRSSSSTGSGNPKAVGSSKGSSSSSAAEKSASQSGRNSWIAKNKDSLPDGLQTVYLSSKLKIMKKLIQTQDISTSTAVVKEKKASFINRPTVAQTFSKSMDELNYLLLSTSCQFIRCIKPNAMMKPDIFDDSYVLQQLRSLGVLQACEVLKVCLPTRIPYHDLRIALSQTIQRVCHLFQDDDPETLIISCLLIGHGIPSDIYRLGRTMAFFRPGQLGLLEMLLKPSTNQSNESQDQQIFQKIQELLKKCRLSTALVANKLKEISFLKNDYDNNIQEFDGLMIRSKDYLKNLQLEQQKRRKKSIREGTNSVVQPILILPDDLLNQMVMLDNEINGFKGIDQQLIDRSDQIHQKITQNSNILSKYFNVSKSDLKNLQNELKNALKNLNQKVKDIDGSYEMIQLKISEMENKETFELSPLFNEMVQNIEDMQSKDRGILKELDEKVKQANDSAIRCDHHGMEDTLQSCSVLMQRILQDRVLLQQYIVTATHELDQCSDGFGYIDYSPLYELIHATEGLLQQSKAIIPSVEDLLKRLDRKTDECIQQERQNGQDSENKFNSSNTHDDSLAKSSSSSDLASMQNRRQSTQFDVKDLVQAKRASVARRTSDASEMGSTMATDLPDSWKELFDHKTNRSYYVNKVTKERQWNKPFNPNAPPTSPSSTEPSPLPPGWREVLDKKSGKFFYVNYETKERQWKRPGVKNRSDSVIGSRLDAHIPDEGDDSEKPMKMMDRISRRISTRDINNLLGNASVRMSMNLTGMINHLFAKTKPTGPTGQETKEDLDDVEDLSLTPTQRHKRKIANARRQAKRRMEKLNQGSEDHGMDGTGVTSYDGGRHSVQHMTLLGAIEKTGYLLKQSKLMGRWKKKYVVLSEDRLVYSDGPTGNHKKNNFLNSFAFHKDSSTHHPPDGDSGESRGKTFHLTGSSMTSFTQTENCFCLSDIHDEDEGNSWYFVADNFHEMEAWMTAINSHIHVQYMKEHHIDTDYWDQGVIELTFWKVPINVYGTLRRPVGIRTLPITDGPRTGEGLFPGEIVEVVQTLVTYQDTIIPPYSPDLERLVTEEKLTTNIQRFLRLADDRGWVFENHPTGNYAIMQPCEGKVLEIKQKYLYSDEFLENLVVYFNPSTDPDQRTGSSILPGTEFLTCAEFTPKKTTAGKDDEDDEDDEEGENDDSPFEGTYLKLADESGWVTMHHPVTGGVLLEVIPIPQPNKPNKPNKPSDSNISTSNPSNRAEPDRYENHSRRALPPTPPPPPPRPPKGTGSRPLPPVPGNKK